MTERKRIFIVEDDLLSAQYLKEMLEAEGFEISGISNTAEGALNTLSACEADLVLMDIMLKGTMSGSEAAMRIKRAHPECKIIFLTAYADKEMIEQAAEAKAVAYLMKPYREREIVATITTVLALHNDPDETGENIVLKNGYAFNKSQNRLELDGKEVPLTETKLKLIKILAEHKNSVVSTEQLLSSAWNEPKKNSTLRSQITRLKKIVGDDLVTNVNGLGYTITT